MWSTRCGQWWIVGRRQAWHHAAVLGWTLSLLATVTLKSSTFATAESIPNIAEEWTLHEVCQWENFDASCPANSVLVVDRAMYGRRVSRPGRCIERTYDRTDCLADVRALAARRCSGRRRCRIGVPGPDLDRSPHGCQRDLKANLEISYHCVSVKPHGDTGCTRPIVVDGQTGLLASIVTEESRTGSAHCPWLIRVDSGQTIELTLIDFGLSYTPGSSRSGGSAAKDRVDWRLDVCTNPYAEVRERALPGGRRQLCPPPPPRATHVAGETVVFRSNSNAIQLVINRQRPPRTGSRVDRVDRDGGPYFLIRYDALGCADFTTPTGTEVDRQGDTAVIRCTGVIDSRELTLHCVNGTWSPTPPTAGCSATTSAATAAVQSFSFGAFAGSKQGQLIFGVIGIAAVVSVIIVVIGIAWLCRSSKRDFRSQRSSDLQYVSAGSAKYDVRAGDVITWKQQQYPYSHQSSQPHHQQMMRQQPDMFLAERDYATTLQMRRTAAQPTSPLLRPGPPDSFDSVAACSCPLHGHLAAPVVDDDFPLPPPPSPRQTATSPRFSSFRPRVEHIYEVPKFVDGGSGDLDDDDAGAALCNSSLYSELDTRAFGTVGRRTPSARGSRRQP